MEQGDQVTEERPCEPHDVLSGRSYIPEGPFKPYRAEQAGQQWYIRAGDNTVVMSRSMLQALFFPRTKALFRAQAELSWIPLDRPGPEGEDRAYFSCFAKLVNDGTATVRNTLVVLQYDLGDRDGYAEPLVEFSPSKLWVSNSKIKPWEFETEVPLHPGRIIELFSMSWYVKWGLGTFGTGKRFAPNCSAPRFQVSVHCENQQTQVINIVFDTEEMLRKRELRVEATPED
jgi:hypothetical protein